METTCTTLSVLVLSLWNSYFTDGQTYTILTPENSSCPSNNTCFTLTEYASTIYHHLEIVSLNLLPGNHTLNVKMVINNIQKFSLYALESDTNSLSWGKVAVISCSPLAGMIFLVVIMLKLEIYNLMVVLAT